MELVFEKVEKSYTGNYATVSEEKVYEYDNQSEFEEHLLTMRHKRWYGGQLKGYKIRARYYRTVVKEKRKQMEA